MKKIRTRWVPTGIVATDLEHDEGATIQPCDGVWNWEVWCSGRYEEGESDTLEDAKAHALAFLAQLRAEETR